MTGSDTTARSVYIWVSEGSWRASVDAALSLAPPAAAFTLLHATSDAAPDAAHGAYLGLFGRGGHDPGVRMERLAATSASELLDAAARRLGRPCERLEVQGHTERAVVAASADADLLIMARDGDRKVLELAVRKALMLGHNYIGTEHLLLGLLEEQEGIGGRTLTALGVTSQQAEQWLVPELAGPRPR